MLKALLEIKEGLFLCNNLYNIRIESFEYWKISAK